MDVAAGARMRPIHFSVGKRCRYGPHHTSSTPALARTFRRPLRTAASPDSGSSGSSAGDVNEALAPILFRFADGPATPQAVGTSNSGYAPGSIGGGPKWSDTVSTGGSTGGPTPPAAVLSGSSSSTSAAPTTSSRLPQERTGAATTSLSDASSHGADGGQGRGQDHSPGSVSETSSHSYSDYYRSTNTPFTARDGAAAAAAAGISSMDGGIRGGAGAATSNGLIAPVSAVQGDACGSAAADSAEVAAALARAQAALERAETSLDDIQRLSSSLDAAALESLRAASRPAGRWAQLLAAGRSVVVIAGLSFAMLASHAFGLAVQWIGAAAGAAAIAGWGLRRRSLAPSGAVAAFLVGFGTLGSSLRFGATLVAFFLSSSKLTAYKEELKEGLEENAKKGGQRSWVQVLCNGLVPTILAVVYGILAGCVDLPLGPAVASAPAGASVAAGAAVGPALEPWRAAALTGLMGGFLGYYACCCGDTWASELGPLSADTPRLITTLRPVRRGTNGGVTLLGLSASIMGGMFVGLVFYLAGLLSPTLWIFEAQRSVAAGQWRLIPLGLMAGLLGSGLDSLLGATVQFSGYDPERARIVSRPGPGVAHIAGAPLLSNNAVNAISATLTAGLTALAALKLFGF